MVNRITKKEVIGVWQHLLLNRAEFITEDGLWLRIIYPGRVNDERGADFRDAVVATGQGLIKGDIEVHVNSRDWKAHKHHLDPAYNRVILHVAMWHDAGFRAVLQNGRRVPVVTLHKYISAHSCQRSGDFPKFAEGSGEVTSRGLSPLCHGITEGLGSGAIARLLDQAGEERFQSKAARFQADLAQMEAGQALFLGIMGALGYTRNKLPFMELAGYLPLRLLESVVPAKLSDEEHLARQQAFLIGTAGLLPSQRPGKQWENEPDDGWIGELERDWTASRLNQSMNSGDWHLFKVRPNNSPVRRMAAMSYLLLRYRKGSLFEEILNGVGRESDDKNKLEAKLVVSTDGYWASHFDFGMRSRSKNPTLLGSGQAANIVVNVLLPFAFAWGGLTSHREIGHKALKLYRNYPKLAENAVVRHMRAQFGLDGSLLGSARRQQGLLHIYKTLCTQGHCVSCPFRQSRPHPG